MQRKKSQGKFVTVIKGKIYDVVLDLRKRSKTYGKHFSIILKYLHHILILLKEILFLIILYHDESFLL